MGSVSIDISLANIWQSWHRFRQGKKPSRELDNFTYCLEQNLRTLHYDLASGNYKHGEYKEFIVTDNKRRKISVAGIRDQVVHRLLYDYLYNIYDKAFIYDVWSCRKGKGLLGAIERTQKFLRAYPRSFVWRADIKKFFDNVNHKMLIDILSLKVSDAKALNILSKVVMSYFTPAQNNGGGRKGMPIGSLTSQIFANIYLNELDRFIKHIIKPRAYLRYGDDFIIVSDNLITLRQSKEKVIACLKEKLRLEINPKNDIMVKAKWGLKFLGVWIFPKGSRLNKRNWTRVKTRLNPQNISSYAGLVKQHSKEKRIREFNWDILEKLS